MSRGVSNLPSRGFCSWVLYLVASSVAETREEGGEFPESRGVGFVFEDYFVKAGDGGDFALVAH